MQLSCSALLLKKYPKCTPPHEMRQQTHKEKQTRTAVRKHGKVFAMPKGALCCEAPRIKGEQKDRGVVNMYVVTVGGEQNEQGEQARRPTAALPSSSLLSSSSPKSSSSMNRKSGVSSLWLSPTWQETTTDSQSTSTKRGRRVLMTSRGNESCDGESCHISVKKMMKIHLGGGRERARVEEQSEHGCRPPRAPPPPQTLLSHLSTLFLCSLLVLCCVPFPTTTLESDSERNRTTRATTAVNRKARGKSSKKSNGAIMLRFLRDCAP